MDYLCGFYGFNLDFLWFSNWFPTLPVPAQWKDKQEPKTGYNQLDLIKTFVPYGRPPGGFFPNQKKYFILKDIVSFMIYCK
jgi:hypothetical protein